MWKTKFKINPKKLFPLEDFLNPLQEWGLYMVGRVQQYMVQTKKNKILVPSWIGIKVDRSKPDPPNQKEYRRGKKKQKGSITKKPLVNTGNLRNSIRSQANPKSVRIGTTVPYAYRMHHGGNNPITQAQRDEWLKRYGYRVKTKSINVIPRPFLYFKPED